MFKHMITAALAIFLATATAQAQPPYFPAVRLFIVDHQTGQPLGASHNIVVVVSELANDGRATRAFAQVSCAQHGAPPCIGADGVFYQAMPNPGRYATYTIQVRAGGYVSWADEFMTNDDTRNFNVRLSRKPFLMSVQVGSVSSDGGSVGVWFDVQPGIPNLPVTPLALRGTLWSTTTTGEQVVLPLGNTLEAYWPAGYGGTPVLRFADFRIHQYVPSGSYFCVQLYLSLQGLPTEPLANGFACTVKPPPLAAGSSR